jgi:DNA-directed RNA polymerase specialized sigma subunit
MSKFSNVERDEFRKYVTQVNDNLVRNNSKTFDSDACFKKILTKERQFQKMVKEYKCWEIACTNFFQRYSPDFVNEQGEKEDNEDKESLLTAKEFFRERVGLFKAINVTIRNKDNEQFHTYKFNYRFIEFIRETNENHLPVKLQALYDSIVQLRSDLIVNNAPLAIKIAKDFFDRVPRNTMSLMDAISIANSGLCVGIDKCETNTWKSVKSVAIGRMVGFLIKEYSDTFISLFPREKKILYRAKSLLHKNGIDIEDIEALTKLVNESFEEDRKNGTKITFLPISETYLSELLNSAYSSNGGSSNNQDVKEGFTEVYERSADSKPGAEQRYLDNENMILVLQASKDLSILQRKVIKLKGVTL